MAVKVISKNRKVFHDYEVGDRFEAGLALAGTEVKALRIGKVNINDGWIEITDQHEAILKGVHIGHYTHGNIHNHEERRDRKLLLNKKELDKLDRFSSEKGHSIVPIKIYFKNRYIKIEIALGRGKKNYDKRQSSKEKDANRDISRVLRHKNR